MLGQGAIHGAPLSLVEASRKAAEIMTREYRELIATLPEDWARKVFAWLRVNGPSGDEAIKTGDVFGLEAWMKTGLLACIDAGMTPVIMTSESLADLGLLRKDVAYFNLIPQEAEEVSEPAPQSVTVDPLAKVVADWSRLDSTSFRKKYLENAENRKVYERACAEGKI